MTPRAEYISLSALAAGVAVWLSAATRSAALTLPWGESFKWVVPALLAGAAGTWLATRPGWALPRRAGRLALRSIALALGCYVVVLVVAGVALTSIEGATWQWTLAIVFFGLLESSWGIGPLSLFQYALSRRYLRRVQVITDSP